MNTAAVRDVNAIPQRTRRISTVEFWRFAFTVLVCVYHFEIYFTRRSMLVSGSSAVEFFFVLAGFLMAKSACKDVAGRIEPFTSKEAREKAVLYVKKKLKGIYPVLLTYLALWAVWVFLAPASPFSASKSDILNIEWELLLMVGTPFGFNNGLAPNIPMWFLTALIGVGYIYTYIIYRYHDFMLFAAPALGVLFYVYFALNASSTLDHSIAMGFLNAGMVKAAAEISLGISVYCIYERITRVRLGALWKFLLSMLEYYAVYRFFALTLWQPVGTDNYRRIVYIMLIVLFSFLNVTVLTRLLNRRIWEWLGKITLAMYICHFTLIQVYFQIIAAAKAKALEQSPFSDTARSFWRFLQDTGGYNERNRPVPMTGKDVFLYMLLVMLASVLIAAFCAAVGHFVVKPLKARLKVQNTVKTQAENT